jgi:hypothetical protein
MALKDHNKHFPGLQVAPTPADLQVPNTVSRHAKTGDRAFTGIVSESGKPVLDAELNLHSDAQFMESYLLRQQQAPSGWVRGRTHLDGYCDYSLGTAPGGVTDDNGGDLVHADDTLVSSLVLPRLVAHVAGRPVVVEYTNTGTKGYNLVGLSDATIYDGTNTTVKRTDFVFLEVWKALVAPSPRASGFVQIVSNADLNVGDTIDINGTPLTAVAGAPAVDEFQIGANEATTASNIAIALNAIANSFAAVVSATSAVDIVTIKSVDVGDGDPLGPPLTGNYITLSVTVATIGAMLASGPNLVGGSDRPNKPSEQDKLFRHGNVLSPSLVWLDDELVDPIIDAESSQRIQLQYRIRATDVTEQVGYKKHPDGFSSLRSGGGPNDASIFGQGNRDMGVYAGNANGDTLSYPFVKADGVATWLDSDASVFEIVDDGLWIAGDGSEAAAQALGAVDGFVYAIPVCFVHRHNNVSDSLAGFKGFDPVNNANGAPTYDHAGYNGPLGVIAAGESDRPDGHFCDVITQENLLDLRRHVVFPGMDLAAELQYQMQSLFDGSLRSWSVDAADKQTLGGDSGDVSTRFLVCNEIGRSLAQGGNAPFSGDTDRGTFVRNFDHVARRFGDQPVVERMVVAFYPGDRPDGITQGGPVAPGLENLGKYTTKHEDIPGTPVDTDAWYEDDVLVLDLEEFDASTLGGIWQGLDGDGPSAAGLPASNFTDFAPPGTVITDILGMWHDDGHYTTAVIQDVQAKTILGLGTQKVEITLDGNGQAVNGGDSGNPDQVMVGSDLVLSLPAGTDFTFADTNPDTITRNDAGNFIADGFVDGMQLVIASATNPANNGTYTIGVGGVAAGTLTLIVADSLTAEPNDLTASITTLAQVPSLAEHFGSQRRVFVEVEITYPIGVGLTDTPDHEVTPSAVVYDGTGQGPGPIIETTTSQRPADFESLLAPRFRNGYRETQVEYVANDTVAHGVPAAGTPIGGVTGEQLVSMDRLNLRFPRRVFGTSAGPMANQTAVVDAVVPAAQAVDDTLTEFGSSSRLVVLDSGLSGNGQTLCDIQYFAQDPVPNYGVSGGGYQVGVYFRTNAPQTAGVKEGDIGNTGDGVLPTTLQVEPLLMSPNVWTGQVGVGASHNGFPYAVPLDQIPINDGTPLDPGNINQQAGTVREWYFAASAMVAIDDFNASTGLLALHPFVQGDVQNILSFGGAGNDEKPRKDAEFRAFYPYADVSSYRPTILSQPLHGATRHKVMAPMLVRAVEDVTGVAGGILFRKSELVLVVLTRFAELDDENNVRFLDDTGANRTLAAVYRTRNLLLTVGDRTCL